MRIFTLVLLIVTLLGASAVAEPAFAVIVHHRNKVRALDKHTARDIFLKKRTQWGDESTIFPVDLKKSSAVRRAFSEQVLGRSISSVRQYWNRQLFSGRGVPPPELDTDDAVIDYVSKHTGAIGYVSATANLKDANVKIIEVR